MTAARDEEPERCPECGTTIGERDPLIGWWLCDDCELAITDDGTVVT
ncbi:hypothetical protein [Natrinema salaciae]|uniref:Uncharacterized protein n=1 Tax=Natrinema salaciae TaxID=1186196 RepID=A0A1H9M3U1_9EURY|nr:hypothetical protein [Natrinema salaciae]SER17783.1 hypothetical protein SAMN04489841_3175 [Natrinema salaciae]